MCRVLMAGVVYAFKALFFLLWDGLKALVSPFKRKRPQKYYGDEICLVTGAAQGLGRLLALELAERHAVLVILDIQEEALRKVAEEIREIGSRVYWYMCDCSSREDVYKVAAQVKKTVGDVSVLINNAGIVSGKSVAELSEEEVEHTFKVNTLAHFWTVKAFLPWMMENNYGHIVQVASILGCFGQPRFSDYCASKAAAIAFSDTLRQELRAKKKTGISVTCACPGQMHTTMFAGVKTRIPWLFGPIRPEQVAERVLLAMEERQFLLVVPRLLYLIPFMKSFVPTRTWDAISDFVGADTLLARHKQQKDK